MEYYFVITQSSANKDFHGITHYDEYTYIVENKGDENIFIFTPVNSDSLNVGTRFSSFH